MYYRVMNLVHANDACDVLENSGLNIKDAKAVAYELMHRSMKECEKVTEPQSEKLEKLRREHDQLKIKLNQMQKRQNLIIAVACLSALVIVLGVYL